MRVYVCAAMTNAERRLADIVALVSALEAAGHDIPTRHVALGDALALDRDLSDRELAARDLGWLAESDAVIAEVTTPSHGVGVEVAHAVHLGKPVLLLHRRNAVVSRLLTGLPEVERYTYEDSDEAAQYALHFLAKVGGEGW